MYVFHWTAANNVKKLQIVNNNMFGNGSTPPWLIIDLKL